MKKRIAIIAVVLTMALTATVNAENLPLESYISGFNYAARKEMKIDSKTLVKGITEGNIQLIDIRFKEEFEAWRMGVATSIPLNELPARLNELQKDKIIVTTCPHKDRAIIAMTYLRTKGFNSKYLTDGLIGLAENLRGDRAKAFVDSLNLK